MQVACGALHWSPSEFWNSTYFEFTHAYVGHLKQSGEYGKVGTVWSKRDLDKAKEQLGTAPELVKDGGVPDEVRAALKEQKRDAAKVR